MEHRLARPDDHERVCELFALLDPTVPDRTRWERDFMARTLVVEGAHGLAGCVYFDVFRESAYVNHFVVGPDSRGCGVGRGLMLALAQHLLELDIGEWALNVAPENTGAVALYESLGMVAFGSTASLRFPWTLVDALPAGPPELVTRVAEPSEDEMLEGRFELARGQIDVGRRKQGRHVIATFEDALPVALAVFAPLLPGTWPFRVSRPEILGSLLSSLRRLRDPGRNDTLVAVDDDPELERLLVAHGAEVYMRSVRYHGSLPRAQR